MTRREQEEEVEERSQKERVHHVKAIDVRGVDAQLAELVAHSAEQRTVPHLCKALRNGAALHRRSGEGKEAEHAQQLAERRAALVWQRANDCCDLAQP